jgi:A/G-specific adenine glycosylase
MLQQTQVVTVIPYYERFLNRFPHVRALADAPEQDVLAHWSGLGYYSRARGLHKGARQIVDRHGGVFPRERAELLAVPGIGPYTAGAVSSIAFDLPTPLVDGNVQRVFSRFFAVEALLESKAAHAFFWRQAEVWVQLAPSPRIFNQALMELGATICTKGKPKCGQCPLAESCKAFAQGNPERYPLRKPRRRAEKLWWAALVHHKGDRLLFVRNGAGDWWHGLWDFPRVEASDAQNVEPAVRQALAGQVQAHWERALPWQFHTVTHHRIHVSPVVLGWKGKADSEEGRRWLTADEAHALPLSALAKKILRSYAGEGVIG